MKTTWSTPSRVAIALVGLILPLYVLLSNLYEFNSNDYFDDVFERLTIRVNTFRRPELLQIFIDHYSSCPLVANITVVWSDQENQPEKKHMSREKVQFEVHHVNSLSNRFLPLLPVTTEAVFSVDDDIAIPCTDLSVAYHVWQSNPRALVGFSPRIAKIDENSGNSVYSKWQHTWWNGFYNIMLTKSALFHRNYLDTFKKEIPPTILQKIDDLRNCEDIAMAYVIAAKSSSPPVWVKAVSYETGSSGISSGSTHFVDRSSCLALLEEHFGKRPWVTGYQKSYALNKGFGLADLFRLWLADDS